MTLLNDAFTEALDGARASRAVRLAGARERLQAPERPIASVWPALFSAFLAATAALTAAATVILGAPAIGAPSERVMPAVSHVVGP